MLKKRKSMSKKEAQRKGIPFTLYLSAEQAKQLEILSRQRRVAKAAVVRFAVDRLLTQLGSGQLELPLGIE
jgi:hypothetical protein